jgi:hypothetical protein
VKIRHVRAKPLALILVCGKCPKRNGSKDRLTKPLKKLLKPARMKVVVTRCVGVCPGNATVLHDSRKAGEWIVVKDGTSAEDVAASLVEPVGVEPLLVEAVGERGLS